MKAAAAASRVRHEEAEKRRHSHEKRRTKSSKKKTPKFGNSINIEKEIKEISLQLLSEDTDDTTDLNKGSTSTPNSSVHGSASPRFAGVTKRNGETTIGRLRDRCGAFVNSRPVQSLTTFLIVANAVILGVLTFDSITENPTVLERLEAVDLSILIVFTMEFLLQFIYLGFATFWDGWLVFDAFVVTFGWIFLDSSVSILRAFRIFRIFSLVARWESLRILFEAVGKTLPKMASIWLVLMIFFYVFAVLMTTLYKDLDDLEWNYFGRLDYTFITLFQIMTLDSWTGVVREVMQNDRPYAWIGFFAFVIITAFFVINLVVAVICESLIELQKSKNEEAIVASEVDEQLEIEKLREEQVAMRLLQRDMLRTQVEMQQMLHFIADQLQFDNSYMNRSGSVGHMSREDLRADVTTGIDHLSKRDEDDDGQGSIGLEDIQPAPPVSKHVRNRMQMSESLSDELGQPSSNMMPPPSGGVPVYPGHPSTIMAPHP